MVQQVLRYTFSWQSSFVCTILLAQTVCYSTWKKWREEWSHQSEALLPYYICISLFYYCIFLGVFYIPSLLYMYIFILLLLKWIQMLFIIWYIELEIRVFSFHNFFPYTSSPPTDRSCYSCWSSAVTAPIHGRVTSAAAASRLPWEPPSLGIAAAPRLLGRHHRPSSTGLPPPPGIVAEGRRHRWESSSRAAASVDSICLSIGSIRSIITDLSWLLSRLGSWLWLSFIRLGSDSPCSARLS
jgi:hypothetical protein